MTTGVERCIQLPVFALVAAGRWLPREAAHSKGEAQHEGFLTLLARGELLRMFMVGFSGFFVFSSTFNYLPFYLAAPPFEARTEVITLMYLAYVVGIFMGPAAGKLSNRLGSGATMALGAMVFAVSIASTLIPSPIVIAASLAGICAGFFAIHAAALGWAVLLIPLTIGFVERRRGLHS